MGTTESDKRHYFVEIVLSRTGFVDAGSEHALHQAYLLLPLAVCPAGFIGRNKSQEAVPRALHWDHLTSTVTSTETPWHPDKSSSLFDVTFSGLGSTERVRMLIEFFLIAQLDKLEWQCTLENKTRIVKVWWLVSSSSTHRDERTAICFHVCPPGLQQLRHSRISGAIGTSVALAPPAHRLCRRLRLTVTSVPLSASTCVRPAYSSCAIQGSPVLSEPALRLRHQPTVRKGYKEAQRYRHLILAPVVATGTQTDQRSLYPQNEGAPTWHAAPALADDGIITWQRGQCTSMNIGSGAQYKSPPQLLSAGHDAATTMGRSPLLLLQVFTKFHVKMG
ncbi:uncharacterized protein [Dermacentor albipictus]|uniref:uncharacterized protein isoform X2 n=1 Tax=Dermacentor albipictus TaxID=60249 RepID=UPI0038FD3458